MLGIRQIFAFLLKVSRDLKYVRLTFLAVIALGTIGGLSNTALIAAINESLRRHPDRDSTLVWVFAVLCVTMPLFRFLSDYLLIHLARRSVTLVRMKLCERILQAPLRRLEALGAHHLLASLTEDVRAITNALVSVPLLCMNVTIIVGCLGYLTYLSRIGLVTVLFFMAVGITSYQWALSRAERHFQAARRYWSSVFESMRALTEGIKELKLHRQRRREFVDERLYTSSHGLQQHNIAGDSFSSAAASWGQILFFILIGVVIFALPEFEHLERETLTGYALTVLYMVNPLQTIMGVIPGLSQAQVAVNQVETLGLSLVEGASSETQASSDPEPGWEKLDMVGVTHVYYRESEEDNFKLGPITLSLRPGELVFVVGGNGSGKTTLAKLLIGLYIPESGEIRLDGELITDQNRDHYRQRFTAVFSDFFLFETMLGLRNPDIDAKARGYLEKLYLEKKVKIENGTLSSVNLSQGQRKRLALLTAYLEDRPIYLFDEWAADQDPVFKEIFYRQLLPELKARGKTVIVISHDDRYYGVGDRLIKLDYGRIKADDDTDETEPLTPEQVSSSSEVESRQGA